MAGWQADLQLFQVHPYFGRPYMKLPQWCCDQRTRDTGHGHFICSPCGKKYDRHGRDVAKVMRGVDIDAIHYKLGALRKVRKAA